MTHSAELARRMAKARMGTGIDRRTGDRFERHEPEHLRRLPWESEATGLPWATNWGAVWDGIVFFLCAIALVLILTGVLP